MSLVEESEMEWELHPLRPKERSTDMKEIQFISPVTGELVKGIDLTTQETCTTDGPAIDHDKISRRVVMNEILAIDDVMISPKAFNRIMEVIQNVSPCDEIFHI